MCEELDDQGLRDQYLQMLVKLKAYSDLRCDDKHIRYCLKSERSPLTTTGS